MVLASGSAFEAVEKRDLGTWGLGVRISDIVNFGLSLLTSAQDLSVEAFQKVV